MTAAPRKKREAALPRPGEGTRPLFVDPPAGRLLDAASRGALRAGMILAGEEGIGKQRLALEMARRLNCLGDEGGVPCRACHRILAGIHPDVITLRRDGEMIKVEPVRAIVESAAQRPYEGKFRVTLVDEAERLNPSSGNALLKVLEEPPPHLVFLLVTSRPDEILPTIRSRVPLSFVPSPSAAEAHRFLVGLGWPAEEAERATAILGGRVGAAIRGLHRPLLGWRERWLASLTETAATGSVGPLMVLVGDLVEEDERIEIARLGAALLRDARVAVDDPSGSAVRHREEYGALADLGRALPPRFANGLARDLLALPDRLTANANRRLAVEDLLLSRSVGNAGR